MLTALLAGPAIDRTLLIMLALALAVAGFLVLRRSPRLAVAVWIVVLSFVPIWIGLNVGFNGNYYLPAPTAAGLLVIAALIPVPGFRPSLVDGLVILLVVVGICSVFTGGAGVAISSLFFVFTYFIVAYVLGRLAPLRTSTAWVHGVVAVVFTIVALFAIVEGLTKFNPFVTIHSGNALDTIWGSIQERGGVPRAEGAFGHSIALGASLALAVPLALAAPFRLWLRATMVLGMLLATVFTFSRIGMICALLGLVLSILFMRDAISHRARIILVVSMLALSAVVFPLITAVYDDAGTEASNSAGYRGDLLSLIGTMSPIGVAASAQKDSAGNLYFGNFRSIDSQLILTGLTNGWIMLIAILVALAVGLWLVLSRHASPATIALVAQIPAFATVALITQYSIFVWFVAGLAATSQLAPRARAGTILDTRTEATQRHAPSSGQPALKSPA